MVYLKTSLVAKST